MPQEEPVASHAPRRDHSLRKRLAARGPEKPPEKGKGMGMGEGPQLRDVIQTPTSVTASPKNIATVNGSENSAQAQSMVTGGLR